MRKLFILNDGSTIVTENMEAGSPVGIKEVHEIDGLSEEEFEHLLNNRSKFTPVKDKDGNLTELRSPQRRLKVSKPQENI